MIYEIVGLAKESFPSDVEEAYENPKSARLALLFLRTQFPTTEMAVAADGVRFTDAELDAAVESYGIAAVREEDSRLPRTYRRGWGTESDDVATDPDGNPTKVWGPDNP